MTNLLQKGQRSVVSGGISLAIKHAKRNPEKGIKELADFFSKNLKATKNDEKYGDGENAFSNMDKLIGDPNGKWFKYAENVLTSVNDNVIRQTLLNFAYDAGYVGLDQVRTNKTKYNCNIPWTILFDPTSACNLKCTGCWAAEYGHKLNLSNDDMEKIVSEGKALGSKFYIMTGGEPTTRMNDILDLATRHNDCYFHLFSNGTLITEEHCKIIQKLGNVSFALSLEGAEDVNDGRRGDGVYNKVLETMDLLTKYGIFFGISACYTSANYESITSDWYIDLITSHGAKLIWYFHYMPTGMDAVPELLPTPDQREHVFRRIREIRSDDKHLIMPIDFQGDAQYVGGCIAGGKNYLHINSKGDVEPCVFIHYSSANIKDENTSLLDALQQPLFMKYHQEAPFNRNMLMPCPMLENSGKLTEMVKEAGAHSTEVNNPESVEHLCAKTKQYAINWAPRAKALSEEFQTFTTSNEALRKLDEADDLERVKELTRNTASIKKAKARV